MTAQHAKLGIGVLICTEALLMLIFLPRVTTWWWALRMRTRIGIACLHLAVIVAVGIWHQLGGR